MIDAEEDEDVVFEGSAIHQHLQSIGCSDYEITQTVSSHQQSDSLLQARERKIEWPLIKQKLIDRISSLIWPKELRKSFYKRIVKNILKTRLLISDDQLLLRHFVPHTFVSPDKPADHSVIAEILFWCMRSLLLSTLILSVFLFVGESTRWSSIFLALMLTVVVWIATVSWMLYKSSSEMENFVAVLQNTAHLVSKSLRLLLEEDLVSRGFVLAQGSSSFQSRDAREAPHCQGLRQSLHSTLYALLPVLCSSHECLKMFVSYYPCMRGLFDDFEEMDTDQQQDLTEHLKFLKKLVTLVKLQISAVVTELVLCANDHEVFEHVLDKDIVFSSHQLAQVKKELDLLSRHLTYAQSFWQKDIDEVQETKCEQKKNNVYIAIHSLSLHMQAALFRVQDLENRFERSESRFIDQEDVGNSVEDLPSYEFVKEQLNSIQMELHSCQGCLDEMAARVDRKYKIEEEETKADIETPVNKVEDIMAVAVSKKEPIPLFELKEPVIKDEVFEAYVDQEYFDNRDGEKDDDFWNTDAKQERRKIKLQRQQGKRVLHELQPLLNQLREVWEERETAALQRQKAEVSQALYGNDPSHCKKMEPKENEEGRTTNRVKIENCDRGISVALKNVKCNSESVKNNFGDPQSTNQDSFEDSDDERLEAYRRVRKELEMDEKSSATDAAEERDSDDERLEAYKKIKMELDKDKEQEALEVDSDDERLSVYKRVKTEIDKAEEQETLGSLVSGYEKRRKLKVRFSLPNVPGNGLISVENVSESEGIFDDSMELTKNELSSSFQALLDGSKCNDTDKANAANALSVSEMWSDKPLVNVMPICTSIRDDTKSPPKDLGEEVFVHGDDIDDDDDSLRIDWSTVTLPSRMTDTLEDRMQLFCGGQNRGFHAELAAEAQAASQQFLVNRGQAVQTFHGVGDGDEVFGDDESD